MNSSNSISSIDTKVIIPAVNCPVCGHPTIIENLDWHFGKLRTERCDGLIEIDVNKPLEACTWSQELFL